MFFLNLIASTLYELYNFTTSLVFRMFRHYIILTLSGQMSYALFRTIGAISRDHIVANTCGCLSVVWLLLFSGFIISRGMNVFVHLKIAQVLHVLQDHSSCKEFFFFQNLCINGWFGGSIHLL